MTLNKEMKIIYNIVLKMMESAYLAVNKLTTNKMQTIFHLIA